MLVEQIRHAVRKSGGCPESCSVRHDLLNLLEISDEFAGRKVPRPPKINPEDGITGP